MYPVVVSDLDGTLLNSQHKIASRTKEVIRRLSEQGIKFVFATGRHYEDVKTFRSQVGIDMYTITSNGVRVYNPAGEVIIRHDLEAAQSRDIIKLARKYDDKVILNAYTEDHWYVERECKELLAFSEDSGFTYSIENLDDIPHGEIIKLFFCSEKHEDMIELEQEIKAVYGDTVATAFSLPTCLEVMPAGVNKGYALNEVLALKKHTLAETIAFGDGMNDVEMLNSVGKALIMENGQQKLKDLLPNAEVIGHHNDDAVAEYLDQQYSN
ncbi:sugar/pyridoxal phosphate phosphatase YigL [Endozoicomonas sp. OPT23]|uniref:Cof-type HAD-IIB family hydrolase n=1 Tax=Endozoicomonas sp. OPT23 TaxID=2072845 RepID=UPI00129A5ACA|nr:Cof-type HAD-IIB family hydrolase [Endozoicomonas sp. OPT23]MRI35360.1 sugar/pyridoxal phosphate phosphatase YigL [Endozoicomonas sp. OPT23]